MASAEIVSNLKLITSGNVPTTSNLGNGELAFGLVDGVTKLYGNVNGTIVDFSDFLRVAPVTSVEGKTGDVTLTLADISSVFVDVDGAKVSINVGLLPTYPGTNTGITWGTNGFGMSQGIDENSGIWFDGDGINMWSPCDRDAITYYDENDGSKVFRVTSTGIVYRKDGKRALYEGEAGGGTPYVTTISSWSGSSGNYYKRITAITHGKGRYPSVHTYVQNESLWEETYDSPAIDASGNVTVYTNSAISIKVVIK